MNNEWNLDKELDFPFNLSTRKTFLAQIKSSSLPDQEAALKHFINVKCSIGSLSKIDKTHKGRWFMK